MLETMFENALLDYYRGGNSYEDSDYISEFISCRQVY